MTEPTGKTGKGDVELHHLLSTVLREDGEYAQLLAALKKQGKAAKPLPILVNGLCEGATDAFLLTVLTDLAPGGATLLICPEEKMCLRLSEQLRNFGLRTAFYTGRDLTFYTVTASHEYEHERLLVLSGLLGDDLDVVLTTPDAALGYTIPPEKLLGATLRLNRDMRMDLREIARRLTEAGYSRAEMVDGKGQFALRGGILDVYPPGGHYTDENGQTIRGARAVRVELFGDEIDRMGLFDVETQRMETMLTDGEFFPAREVLADAPTCRRLFDVVRAQLRSRHGDRAEEELRREAAMLESASEDGGDLPFLDKYITLIYPEKSCLLDYFGAKCPVFLLGTNNIYERLKAARRREDQTVEELVTAGTIAPKYAEYIKTPAEFEAFLQKRMRLHIDSLSYGLSGQKTAGLFGFRTKQTVSYGDRFDLLFEDLGTYLAHDYRVILIAENETAAKNLHGLLSEKKVRTTMAASEQDMDAAALQKGGVVLIWQNHMAGFELITPHIAVLSTAPDTRVGALSVGERTRAKHKKSDAARAILSYADLSVGDLVVHETYGIGCYTGIEHLTTGGVTRDYIGIRYAGSDKLFLPTDQLDKVSKYIGAHADDGQIKLSRFGGDAWNKTKARVRASVRNIAKDLIRLYAERERRPGFAFPPDDDFQRSFEAAFAYEETEGQLRAAEDVKQDMMAATPMDRLLCGDVGFGKTEVALRAAYKAVLGGKQVAVLVPTTILALQHYQTFTSRMRAFGVEVDMISRFRTPAEQAATLRRLRRGEVDVLIGTHRLIGKDITFCDLGLLIVDEEQRFGVVQKEKLKQMAGNVDVLTLSATPIPRTLNMAMGGLRDISVLDEAPGDRLPVQTYVLEEDDLILYEAIRKELRRGGQVFYLHNAVETIDGVATRLAEAIPEARITVAHGKMERERMEAIWEKMLMGEIDILVCTTIIETGVDVPNANTLIVDHAERLGLSQLHQLRGRVGRSSRRAYAYFTYPKYRALTEIAQKRLEAIRDYAEFGAGFKIALRDMEIRGAGNLLGTEQHGHMDAVGYDLYIKLLQEAVLDERGQAPTPQTECTVSFECDAYIPEKYVAYPAQRMEMYKKIAMIENEQDRADILDEMLDRFGELPRATENLLDIALVRADGKRCAIRQITQEGGEVRFYPVHFEADVWVELADLYPGRMRVVPGGELRIVLKLRGGENVLPLIHKMFEKYTEIVKANAP